MVDRFGCCATWPKPCPYHEGWVDGEDSLTTQLAEMTRERDKSMKELEYRVTEAHKTSAMYYENWQDEIRACSAAEQRVKELEDVVDAARAEVLARGYRSTDMAKAMEALWGEFWFETYVESGRPTCGFTVTVQLDDGPLPQSCKLYPHGPEREHQFSTLANLPTDPQEPT